MYSVRSVLACLFAAITFVACDAPQTAPPRIGQPAQQPVASGSRSGSSSSAVHQSRVVEYYTISLDDVTDVVDTSFNGTSLLQLTESTEQLAAIAVIFL